MLETARVLSDLNIDGVKIHSAHVLKHTQLADMYRQGTYQVLELPEYIDLVCDFLEHLARILLFTGWWEMHPENGILRRNGACRNQRRCDKLKRNWKRRNSYQGSRVRYGNL